MMKKLLILLGCLAASIGIVFLTDQEKKNETTGSPGQSLLNQEVLRIEEEPHEVNALYSSGRLVGILADPSKLDSFLKQEYQKKYAEQYPGSSLSLGKDVYVVAEQTYFYYADIDDAICSYLDENNLFTIGATAVEFSDENGIYAEIYVLNENLYEEAMQEYISYFIDSTQLAAITNGNTLPEMTTYGSQATGFSISQTITTHPDYADPAIVKTTKSEVLDYLEYGDDTEKEYYTVQQYDTVAGVGSKNHGLSATQVMNINRDRISSVDQVLPEGEQLCVTYFNSPIDIVVTMESMRKETIYPETLYVEDDTIREGESMTQQEGVNGSRNTLYSERWINGVLVSGTKISSVDTLQPQNEIIAIGSLQIPGIGTGTFRWPVDNPHISCGWGCYYGHRGVDITNAYSRYGNIYAADRGVVEENDYNSINGNYILINHNNGFETYYGHMYARSPLAVGTVVDKGDVIGQIGMTGRATGPHTHFVVIENGNHLNACDGFLDCSAAQ